MVKSIKQGVFFDQKYWARHSKNGRILKPVYFSSLIAGDALQICTSIHRTGVNVHAYGLTKRKGIVRSNGQNTTTKLAGEIGIESDCEDESTETEEGASAHRQVRAILIPGSFAA